MRDEGMFGYKDTFLDAFRSDDDFSKGVSTKIFWRYVGFYSELQNVESESWS